MFAIADDCKCQWKLLEPVSNLYPIWLYPVLYPIEFQAIVKQRVIGVIQGIAKMQ
jgi:hypothetical protein